MKKISDSYLYQTADYNKKIFEYLMSAERVDKNADGFADVVYAIKKQANAILMKVLLSDKVTLMIDPNNKGVARPFKVIYVKDIKDHKQKRRVFIDCTGIISKEDSGEYSCKKIGTMIAYLMGAMTYILYYSNPALVLGNHTIMKNGTGAFVDMAMYVLGYLKVPITYADNKERMSFVLAEYFAYCVAGIGMDSKSNYGYNLAKQISGITDKKTCDYLHTLFSFTFADGDCKIDKFIEKFAEVFLEQTKDAPVHKNRNPLTVEAFSHRWMYAFGPNTFIGLECFVPFAQILTDCYSGAFINQQNTIEKVAGSKVVVAFTNELLKVGSENA